LAEQVLQGTLKEGDTIQVDRKAEAEELTLSVVKPKATRAKKGKSDNEPKAE
jgi:hypothetical protein